MYNVQMRKQHEGFRIQIDKGRFRIVAGRASGCPLSFEQAGRQQHRDGLSESEQVVGGLDAGVRRSFEIAIQRTQRFNVGTRLRHSWRKEARPMTRGRKRNPLFAVRSDLPVMLHPTSEPASDFMKRHDEVQSIVVKMILLSKRRGRPSEQDQDHEEAA